MYTLQGTNPNLTFGKIMPFWCVLLWLSNVIIGSDLWESVTVVETHLFMCRPSQ